MTQHTQDLAALRGQDLYGRDGEKLGKIEEIYLDTDSGRPEWAVVTTGLFGTKQSFVPIGDFDQGSDQITVPYDKATVKDAPSIDPDGRLAEDEERRLYEHYGRSYESAAGSSGRGDRDRDFDRDRDRDFDRDRDDTVGRDTSGPASDDAMTRSEEELRVGTAERETGRVRLRKVVVEDEATQTVPVRREEIRVEREPITDANVDDAMGGPEISEEEHEVVLHEEEPVAEKRVVPKERVRLDKDVHTDEREITESVRKEHIEVDDDQPRTA